MLSAIVLPQPVPADRSRTAGPLLSTLAALVPATVEGVVRDVTLLQVGEDSDVARIADEAGCGVVADELFPAAFARGVAGARAPWIFAVLAGTVPSRMFGEEAARAISDTPPSGGVTLREMPRDALARWFPSRAAVVGVILPRSHLAHARCTSFADLVRLFRRAPSLPSAATRA